MPNQLTKVQYQTSNFSSSELNQYPTYGVCSGNQIVNANGLRALYKLNHLNLNNNKVMDLSAVQYLKAKGCFGSGLYTNYQKQPSQQEIDESRLW
ncbi:Leucine-rich_repeat [Hexamita inflata]|uniref:Leucine-rich repeat n=1 Tax=Hexamita inflata TaxID=28002 RepID=A0AA86PFM6_9EUKA|nr:Leucine-rich repeat [Hexamita inflata]